MGNAVRLAGRPRGALKYLRRAARAWPENHLAYAGMGRALLDAGEYERALRHLDRALRRQPGDRIVLKDREEALGKIGRAGGGGNPARAQGNGISFSAPRAGLAAGARLPSPVLCPSQYRALLLGRYRLR